MNIFEYILTSTACLSPGPFIWVAMGWITPQLLEGLQKSDNMDFSCSQIFSFLFSLRRDTPALKCCEYHIDSSINNSCLKSLFFLKNQSEYLDEFSRSWQCHFWEKMRNIWCEKALEWSRTGVELQSYFDINIWNIFTKVRWCFQINSKSPVYQNDLYL